MREIKFYTGISTLVLFSEAIDRQDGYSRIYLTKKPLRLLRRLRGKIYLAADGRYFRRLKIQQ